MRLITSIDDFCCIALQAVQLKATKTASFLGRQSAERRYASIQQPSMQFRFSDQQKVTSIREMIAWAFHSWQFASVPWGIMWCRSILLQLPLYANPKVWMPLRWIEQDMSLHICSLQATPHMSAHAQRNVFVLMIIAKLALEKQKGLGASWGNTASDYYLVSSWFTSMSWWLWLRLL